MGRERASKIDTDGSDGECEEEEKYKRDLLMLQKRPTNIAKESRKIDKEGMTGSVYLPYACSMMKESRRGCSAVMRARRGAYFTP
jgi:hypothetical protein